MHVHMFTGLGGYGCEEVEQSLVVVPEGGVPLVNLPQDMSLKSTLVEGVKFCFAWPAGWFCFLTYLTQIKSDDVGMCTVVCIALMINIFVKEDYL